MKDERIDLSALAAGSDPAHWDRVVAETVASSGNIVDQYRTTATPLDYLMLWSRPALAAAMVLIVTSIGLLGREQATVHVQNGAAGLATIARVWAAGGPPPSGAVLIDVVETAEP
jgi:hypothetical protein